METGNVRYNTGAGLLWPRLERDALEFPDYTNQYSLLSNFGINTKARPKLSGTRPWGGERNVTDRLAWHHDSIHYVNYTVGLIDIGD